MYQTYDVEIKNKSSALRSLSGLTLLELLISMVLISILLGSIWLVFHSSSKLFYGTWRRGSVKGEVSRALINLSQELRQATSVTSATATSLTFTLDSDSNGVDETLQYTWSGTAGTVLNRILVSPAPSYTTPVVNSVTTLAFSYYNSSNTLLGFPVTLSQLRRVDVSITAVNGDEVVTLRSADKLRCL